MKQVLSDESSVRIEVFGRPRTKGSLVPDHRKIAPGKCRVTLKESGEYSVAWKKEMINAVRAQCEVSRFAGAVVVDTFFRFEKLCLPDQSMPWPVRAAGEFAHGDSDKLLRNVLDSLTQSGLILDDALVVGGMTHKRWCVDGERPGVIVKVRATNEHDEWFARGCEVWG